MYGKLVRIYSSVLIDCFQRTHYDYSCWPGSGSVLEEWTALLESQGGISMLSVVRGNKLFEHM